MFRGYVLWRKEAAPETVFETLEGAKAGRTFVNTSPVPQIRAVIGLQPFVWRVDHALYGWRIAECAYEIHVDEAHAQVARTVPLLGRFPRLVAYLED